MSLKSCTWCSLNDLQHKDKKQCSFNGHVNNLIVPTNHSNFIYLYTVFVLLSTHALICNMHAP